MVFIRKVKTGSGATAIQVADKRYGRIIKIKHIGSAHTKEELDILLKVAKKHILKGQMSLFSDNDNYKDSLSVKLKNSYSLLLWTELQKQYQLLNFQKLQDDIFMALCLARLVEPCSKIDSLRVLADLGVNDIDKNQLYRCLIRVVDKNYRETVSRLCFKQTAHLTIVFTALAIGRRIEKKSGISLKKFIKTLRPIRSGNVVINGQEYTAKEIITPEAEELLKTLHSGH